MAYKLKKVYICDHCSNVSLPDIEYNLISGVRKVMPIGWTKLGKEHLCPECTSVIRRILLSLFEVGDYNWRKKE